ncbi:hypothetical protein [Aureimonas populi]|uniref:Uncharacterized protein n=1 Tax=Aureimonas populi TaxID=1701758 RepID=A0ABW5CMV3_9HYPH|nr:hypothetical protein [Aureimonas populi]
MHASAGRLPTTLGFSPLDDRCRLPGRFFYRRLTASGLLRFA